MDAVRVSMYTHRALQFVGRHHWPLRLAAGGLEIDEFDDDLTTYCIVEEDGWHLASLRLRPACGGSMVERHFPAFRERAEGRLTDGVEVTRFCAAPDLSSDRRLTAVSDLLLGLCRHCQRSGIPGLFGVVFPTAARVIRQAGWPGQVLGESMDHRGTLQMMEWIADEQVAWNIQERREFREELWRRRHEEFQETQLLVA
jgi:N-acyl-L-homoserine lactone synthetase